MDVGDGGVVPRVSESSSVVDETLIGDLGVFDGGEEIMIEVVGSDVFVGGDQFGGNGIEGLGGKGEILVNGDVVVEEAVTAPSVVEESGGEVGGGGSLMVSGETSTEKGGVEVGFVSVPLIVDLPTAQSVSVPEQISVVVKEEVLNCKGEVLGVKSACLEGVQSAVSVESDICATIANAGPRNQLAEGDDVVVNEEDSLHLKIHGTDSKVFDRNLQSPVEDGKLNIKMVGGSSPNQVNAGCDLLSFSEQAIMVSSNQGVIVADDVSSIVSAHTSEVVGLLSGTDGNAGEDSMACLDVGSVVENTQVLADNSEHNDSLVVYTDKTVYVSGADEFLTTESSIVLNENVNCVVLDELKVDSLYEVSKTDDAVCAGPKTLAKKIQVVSGSEITSTDSVRANPLAEGSTTENAVRQTTCADVVQEVKQVFSLEREVSGMYIEKATGKEPGYVSVEDGLSCSVTENHFKIEKETANSGLKSDISIGTEISDKQAVVSEIRGGGEAVNMEDTLTSECDDYVNEVSFRWDDQHLKAIGSSVNDVARGEEDMRTPLEGITISRADMVGTRTSLDDKKYGEQSSDTNMMYDDISLSVEEDAKGENVSKGVTSSTKLVHEVNNDLSTMDDKHIVFSDTHGEKNSKNSDSGSVIGKLVETMGRSPGDDVKKSEEENLEENASLRYEYNGMDDDVEGIDDDDVEGIDDDDVDLHFSERLDDISAANCAGVDSSLDCSLAVKVQYNDVEHVDLLMEQGEEVQDQTLGIENSKVFGEIIPGETSPVSGNDVTTFHTCYLLPPKNEGEFAVSDLVWGKVRSHPWWPGQIFDPADASEKAMKYHKKDCFLVAYFGDRTFAWNDASLLRPFRTHFTQIEKQSNSEAFQHAVNSALAEVSRRVELGLSCSCIPEDALEEIESQIIENTGIHEEAGARYGVDLSTGVSCFEPEKLVDNIRSLALLPSGGGDQLELVIAKAQLSAFSRFRGHRPLPEFQLCEGLLENETNTSELCGINEKQIKGETNSSNKGKHNLSDSRYPSKKERSMTELMGDLPNSSDGEDEPDGNAVDESTTSAGRKRKARDYVADKSDKRISFYAANVSTTPSPKPSFKVGECIRRVASQLTGSPSLSKSNSEKFLKVDDSADEQVGFDVLQTPVYSPRGRIHSPEHPSLDEMLSQLHLAARDPMKGYSFLNTITTFFSDFRHSAVLSQNSRKRNSSTGRGGRKKKAASVIVNSPEDFEFDDVNDSYWTDRIVQNYAEEELSQDGQNGDGEYKLVTYEPDKPLKSGRKSRKRASRGDHDLVVEEPAEHIDEKRQDCSPTELILNFTEGNYVPSELNLNKIFRRFGPLRESETEVDRQTCRAKVVFKKCSDAEVALSSSGKFNIFGTSPVTYELSYVPSAPLKRLLLPAELQPQDDMT